MEKNEIYKLIKITVLFVIATILCLIMVDVMKLTDYFINYVGLG